jgi:hypothetical protein
MLEELKEISKTRFVPGFFYALVYVGLPEDDQAFAWPTSMSSQSGIQYEPIPVSRQLLTALYAGILANPR